MLLKITNIVQNAINSRTDGGPRQLPTDRGDDRPPKISKTERASDKR